MSFLRDVKDGWEEGQRDAEIEAGMISLFIRGMAWIIWHWVGLMLCFFWVIFGIVTAITIVGIPFSKIAFSSGFDMLFSSYKDWQCVNVITDFKAHPIANLLWCCTFGLVLGILHMLFGIMLCMTLVCIPLGTQFIKGAKRAFMPFGVQIEVKE